MKNRKPPTESMIPDWLNAGKIKLAPLRFTLLSTQPSVTSRAVGARESTWDFELRGEWAEQSAEFLVEFKSQSTPKVFADALLWCQTASLPSDRYPLILVPYLRESQIGELEKAGISGVDCCGNGVVIVPNRLRVYRTGAPNQFTSGAPIKNIYRRNTSMIPRVFLAQPQFSDLTEVLTEVNQRNLLGQATRATPMTLGTVSKALKQLEEDLIIERRPQIRLLQPAKLLELLTQNDTPPTVSTRTRLKVNIPFERLPIWIAECAQRARIPVMATGLSSVAKYAVMQREEKLSVYCPDASKLLPLLEAKQTDRFANLELVETSEHPVFFDAVETDGFRWASCVQTYLELMRGDQRDRETAEQVQDAILTRVMQAIR
ncbi:MAG: hypothetical protein NT069_35525 [Planctomycetota bacterium]|nr:hypothetical protein [Planctomycetota bacterium]